MKKIFILCCLIFMMFFSNIVAFSAGIKFEDDDSSYKFSFPAGGLLKVVLLHKLSTATDELNSKVETIIQHDLNMGDYCLIPQNTRIEGKIVKIEKPAIGKDAFLQVMFDYMVFPDGERVPILAHVWTKKGDGIIGGAFTERVGYKKVPHYTARVLPVIQLVPAGPRKMGKDVDVAAGSDWIVVFDKPFEINRIKEY